MIQGLQAALEEGGITVVQSTPSYMLVEDGDGQQYFLLAVEYQPEAARINSKATGAIIASLTPPAAGKLTVTDGDLKGKSFTVRPQVFIHGKPSM